MANNRGSFQALFPYLPCWLHFRTCRPDQMYVTDKPMKCLVISINWCENRTNYFSMSNTFFTGKRNKPSNSFHSLLNRPFYGNISFGNVYTTRLSAGSRIAGMGVGGGVEWMPLSWFLIKRFFFKLNNILLCKYIT